ncbi:MAG: hypothetical protein HY228_02415, partial [Candidatus Yonathbacteria bacterium]|nr:hypothetical protein [Candidatus Yonathbacteria bacterium]
KFEFSEEKFKKFIRSIDPQVVFKSEANRAFYSWEESNEDCPDECPAKDKEELCSSNYEECERRFIDKYEKDKVLENRKNPGRMSEMRLYALLQEDKTTDQERLAKELAPNTGADLFLWNKIIKTPSGGQPGYKIKKNHK